MQAAELLNLAIWFKENVAKAQIHKRYSAVYSVLNQNAQPNTEKKSFQTEVQVLDSAILSVPLQELTLSQIGTLEELNVKRFLGNEGLVNIQNILRDNTLDFVTAATYFQSASKVISEAAGWFQTIETAFEKLPSTAIIQYRSDDEVLIRLNFSHEASIDNVTDFRDWAKVWWEICRGIAVAHNDTPNSFRVVGASTGSVIIDIAACYAFAKTLSAIMKEALSVTERVLEVRKKAEEIRTLKLSNDKIAADIEKEAKHMQVEKSKEIIESQIKELKIDTKTEGEKVSNLELSVKKLVIFLEKGGEVDFILPPAIEDKSDQKGDAPQTLEELRSSLSDLRSMEKRVQLLAHLKESNADEISESE